MTRMSKRSILAIGAAVLLMVAVFIGALTQPSTAAGVTRSRPCQYEDSVNCYWDAGSAGNGTGHSFYAVRVAGVTCLLYTQPRYATKHNRCFVD